MKATFLTADCSEMAEAECLQVSRWLFANPIPRNQITPSACLKHWSLTHTECHTHKHILYWMFGQMSLANMMYKQIQKCQWYNWWTYLGRQRKQKQYLDVDTESSWAICKHVRVHTQKNSSDSLWHCITTHLLTKSNKAALLLFLFRLQECTEFWWPI